MDKVVPVNRRKRGLNIDNEALELSFLLVVLKHLLLGIRANPRWLGWSLHSLPQRVVLVDDQVLVVLITGNSLEQDHLALHLREWVNCQDVVLLKLLDSIEL